MATHIASSAAAISKTAATLYRDAPWALRAMQRGRPYICPLETLAAIIPDQAVVFDIGCGAGLFLGYLASHGRIAGGVGVEPSARAVAAARAMSRRLASDAQAPLDFYEVSVEDGWPDCSADVVSLIDVMHHVHLGQRRAFFEQAVSRVKPGGVLLYKDMAPRPRWRAWANQLHDLAVARQWVRLEPISNVELWAADSGLSLDRSERILRMWYVHELRVWKKPGR